MGTLVFSLGLVPTVQADVFSAGDAGELVDAINQANSHDGADIIELTPETTYTLTEVVDYTDGANGLPSITSEITITGKGAIIARDYKEGTPDFRIFHVAVMGNLTLEELTIRNGRAAGDGRADDGGGIFVAGVASGGVGADAAVTLIRSTLRGNVAQGRGGALFNNDGAVRLEDSTVTGNSGRHGGGICNFDGGIILHNSTFYHNYSATAGGALFNEDGGIVMSNTTLSGNKAESRGGAIFNSDSSATVIHSTITGNHAITGGGIFNSTSTTGLIQSIVAKNDPGGDCAGDGVQSRGFNLDSDGSCLFPSPAAGDLPGMDPLLGPLADNGGHTKTHALRHGSPAKDAVDPGVCLGPFYSVALAAFDQRGVLRPQDTACDSGAFEVEGTSNAHKICATLGDTTPHYSQDMDIFQFTATAGQPAAVILQGDSHGWHQGDRATLIWSDAIQGASLFQSDFGTLPNDLAETMPGTGTIKVMVGEQSESLLEGKQFKGDYCLTLVSPGGAHLQSTGSVE